MDRRTMQWLWDHFSEFIEVFSVLAPPSLAIEAQLAKPKPVDWDEELAAMLEQERRSAD